MSGEGTYAPKSPDLSSFFSSGPTQPPPTSQPVPQQPEPYKPTLPQNTFPHQHQLQHQLQHQHHQPAPADYYSRPVATGPPPQPQPQIAASVHPQSYPPQLSQPHNSATTAYPQLSPLSPHHQYPQPVTQAGAQAVSQAFPPQGQAQTQAGYGLQPPTAYQNYYQPYGDGQYQPAPHSQAFGKREFYGTPVSLGHIPPHPDSLSQGSTQSQALSQPQSQPQSDNMPPRRSAASSSSQQPPAIEPSPVRTKFPTARIKRIMQADEEVGKVAQQTPIAVGKALEMFMIHIVTKSAEVAKEKNSKRVTAAMLKQVVESDEQWDFLREIVSKVDVEQAGKSGGKPKAESESEEEPVEKKKGRGGRKKKAP